MDCVFCKIIAGEIPSNKVYENDEVLAFYDLSPQAPVHILIIPKEHISSAAEVNSQNSGKIAAIFEAAALIAKEEKLNEGYRIVTNIGQHGGQSVAHIHFHLLGGRQLDWPPG